MKNTRRKFNKKITVQLSYFEILNTDSVELAMRMFGFLRQIEEDQAKLKNKQNGNYDIFISDNGQDIAMINIKTSRKYTEKTVGVCPRLSGDKIFLFRLNAIFKVVFEEDLIDAFRN